MSPMLEESTGVSLAAMAPNSEVTAKAERRRFTGEYKRRILREADALREIGGIGEHLRREWLYSPHLSTWYRERKWLAREVARLEKRLAQAEAIIRVQKSGSSDNRPLYDVLPATMGIGYGLGCYPSLCCAGMMIDRWVLWDCSDDNSVSSIAQDCYKHAPIYSM